METKTLIAAGVLALLWLGELLVPFYSQFQGGIKERFRHDLRNLSFGAFNSLLSITIFLAGLTALEGWGEARQFGLLRWAPVPLWGASILGLVLFDLWMYVWHRINHEVRFFWRFHRMHHSDREMDASTGVRFHPGEILLSGLARLIVFPLIGLSLWQLALYESILLPVILFHHSNVALPRWMDRGLLAILVTPAMHRVHHSDVQVETDSNYSSVLSIWDRLFGTFRLREDNHELVLGLRQFATSKWLTAFGMLRTPWYRPALESETRQESSE